MCDTCTRFQKLEQRLQNIENENTEVIRLFTEIKNNATKEVFSVKEAAVYLHKSPDTVSEFCRTGKLKATRTGKKGMYMISSNSIKKFIENN